MLDMGEPIGWNKDIYSDDEEKRRIFITNLDLPTYHDYQHYNF